MAKFSLFFLTVLALFANLLTATAATELDVPSHQARHEHKMVAMKKRAPEDCKSSRVAAAKRASSTAVARAATRKVAGIAWANGQDAALCRRLSGPKVGLYYSWSAYKVAGCEALDFLVMHWGKRTRAAFKKQMTGAKYAKHILAFNEPDHPGQATMSPGEAVSMWRSDIQKFCSKGVECIMPAVTGSKRGTTWLRNFKKQCKGCTFHALALHFYGTNADALIKYVKDMNKEFGLPFYITEYSCMSFGGNGYCSVSQASAFMRKVATFCEKTTQCRGHFYFGALKNMGNVNPNNRLITKNGALTNLGRQFIGK